MSTQQLEIPELFDTWKDVEGYEGLYQVSNTGLIRSLDRFDNTNKYLKGRTLRPGKKETGYLLVVLCKEGHRAIRTVHRLVAAAFIPNPNNLPQVNHIDGVKTNNLASNLEWVTKSENAKHAVKLGLTVLPRSKGSFNSQAKLREEDVLEIKKLLKERKLTRKDIAGKFNVSIDVIKKIRAGITWKHVILDKEKQAS